jgi:hypothetical protein
MSNNSFESSKPTIEPNASVGNACDQATRPAAAPAVSTTTVNSQQVEQASEQSLQTRRNGTQANEFDAASRIRKLLEIATGEYSSSKGSFLLAACPSGPSGLYFRRCEQDDPACGIFSEGCMALPYGCIHPVGTMETKDKSVYQLLAFSRLYHQPDEMNQFLSFAAQAGSMLVACPPEWAPVMLRAGHPEATWIGALMILPHGATRYVDHDPSGSRFVTQPWAMCAEVLRNWQSKAGTGKEPCTANDEELKAKHSADFRSVLWYGTEYYFTPTQAACVKVLWREWESGTPEIGDGTILEDPEVEAEAKRLIDVFRDRKSSTGYHPAWNTMITPGSTKGTFRLNSSEIP